MTDKMQSLRRHGATNFNFLTLTSGLFGLVVVLSEEASRARGLIRILQVNATTPAETPGRLMDEVLQRLEGQKDIPKHWIGEAETSTPSEGLKLIVKERERQVQKKGFTPDKDRQYTDGELYRAAICYAAGKMPVFIPSEEGVGHNNSPNGDKMVDPWPWDAEHDHRSADRVEGLAKAGALIAAEIDRLLSMS